MLSGYRIQILLALLSVGWIPAFAQMKSDLQLDNIKGRVKCMVEMTCYNPAVENCFHRKTVSYYDRRGFLILRDVYDDNVLTARDTVLYDASGNKKEAYWHSYATNDMEKKTFEIDKAQKQIIEYYFNEDGTPGRSMVITFNDRGDIAGYKIIEYNGNLRGRIEYRYDSKGNRVEELTNETTMHFFCRYDESGNKIERSRQTDEYVFRTTYKYGFFDKNGNWQTMTETSNGEPGPTLYTRKFTYW